MNPKILRPALAARALLTQVRKVLLSRLGIGTVILFATGAIYLEPHISGVFSCLADLALGVFERGPTDGQCLADALEDLRRDGTAATVILAIAAAVLASAWSSGGSSASE